MTDNKTSLGFCEKLCIIWFIIDGMTHLTMEAFYLYFAFGCTAKNSDSPWAFIWNEYSRADSRWNVRDTNVMCLELITVCLFGPLCLLASFAVWSKKPWRHALQLIICTAELYGGWMTFGPEWIDGSPHLDGSDWILLWIYLVFMNGLWVVVPVVLLWDSIAQISFACDRSKTEILPRTAAHAAPSKGWFIFLAITILVYIILIPLVLSTAKH